MNDNPPEFGAEAFERDIYENNAATDFSFPVTDKDQVADLAFSLEEEDPFVSIGERFYQRFEREIYGF